MKSNLQSIRPNRFVWHVTFKGNRCSIAKNGLKSEFTFKGAVFANNQSQSLFDMWPLPIDGWDPGFSVYDYDFWRIDTAKAGVKWYVDPFMEEDYKAYGCRSKYDYICTLENICIDAMKLYFYNEYNLVGYPWYYNDREVIQYKHAIQQLSLYEDVDSNEQMMKIQ
jgi:hypothetical protein